MAALKAWVFDLDDTLYAEADYVTSGFRAVAGRLGQAGALPAEEALAVMAAAHARGERGRIFDDLLAVCTEVPARPGVAELIQVYRRHLPAIRLYPGMADLLDEARARALRLAVISDGHLEGQERKVRALGLPRWADPILLTDAWGRAFWKPHPRAYLEVQSVLALEPDQLVYIGDNPAKDFHAADALGWNTVQLLMPGQCHGGNAGSPARHRVEGVGELRERLLAWSV